MAPPTDIWWVVCFALWEDMEDTADGHAFFPTSQTWIEFGLALDVVFALALLCIPMCVWFGVILELFEFDLCWIWLSLAWFEFGLDYLSLVCFGFDLFWMWLGLIWVLAWL